MIIRSLLTLLALAVAPLIFAEGIAGFWKHSEEPGWIEIRVENGVGTGTVVRNDVYPERVGRLLLKDLVIDGEKAGLWKGQVYAERTESYKDAKIRLPDVDQLEITVKVGFMSRTVDWVRVAGIPGE